jgi:hypothetical protein
MVGPEEETDVWRILLFGRCGGELLVVRSALGLRLPELRIPRCQRVAPHLNAEAKRLWKLNTVCLRPLKVPRGDFAAEGSQYHVMELCQPEGLTGVAPDFMQISELKEDSFADPRDYQAVQQGLQPERTGLGEDPGAFSRLGILARISAWVEEQLQPLGLRWDGTFRQLQATDSFSLIRFQTNRGAVWFKATGEPNLREFPLTLELGACFPTYLPVSLATHPEWNAWLAFEAPGRDLWSSLVPGPWLQAADSLAGLQIASSNCVTRILAAGAHDARLENLLSKAQPFFSAMEGIMEMQTKPSPRKLTGEEVRLVEQRVLEALLQMGAAEVPDSLNHLDLNPGNVFVDSGKSTFLDWAEATIGNPFFSFEYLRQHFAKNFSAGQEKERNLEESYVQRWSSILPRKTIETMLRVAPLTAIYAFAASALPWHDRNLQCRHEVAAYLRSLVRRMHRECELLERNRAASRSLA